MTILCQWLGSAVSVAGRHRKKADASNIDVYVQHRHLWVRLREKGSKAHAMPCHHTLETYLDAYLDVPRCTPIHRAAVADDRMWYRATERYFPAAGDRLRQGQCRAAAAGIVTKIGNHTFRANYITAYPAKVDHASTPTTQLTTGITRALALTRWNGFMRSYDRVL